MAAVVARQPFAPLDATRLQALNSTKNTQNMQTATEKASAKRKACDIDDAENVDPKRAKGIATKALFTSCLPAPTVAKRQRTTLRPKVRLNKLSRSAPAASSPTRGPKAAGILNRRRITRVDPPRSSLGFDAPTSIDAALSGFNPVAPSAPTSTRASIAASLSAGFIATQRTYECAIDDLSDYTENVKASETFTIHEDTPEEELQIDMEIRASSLNMRSEEEIDRLLQQEIADGCNKENIPPPGDVSQTSSLRRSRRSIDADAMDFKKSRSPLSEMEVSDFYSAGLDAGSVVIVPGDEDVESSDFTFRASSNVQRQVPATKASSKLLVLEPSSDASFEIWEGENAKDEPAA